jgi:hypothetical protein
MHKEFDKYGTPAEKLTEECSEVIKVCMKIQRFGLDDIKPCTFLTNRERLFEELSDLENAVKNMREYVESVPVGTQNYRLKEVKKC